MRDNTKIALLSINTAVLAAGATGAASLDTLFAGFYFMNAAVTGLALLDWWDERKKPSVPSKSTGEA